MRVTRTSGERSDSSTVIAGIAQLHHARVVRDSARARRRLQRFGRRLLEARPTPRLEAVGREQQALLALLRVLDEGLCGGLAAPVVDRLGLQADVHREQLTGPDRPERDLQAARLVEEHHPVRAGAAVVGVAVDLEQLLAPQRAGGVRRRGRARPPRVLMALQVRHAAGVEEVAARRLGVRAGVEADDGADRLARCRGRALPRRQVGVVVDRLQDDIRDRDPEQRVTGPLHVGLVLVQVRDGALDRAHVPRIGRRRLRQHRVVRAVRARVKGAERPVAGQRLPVRPGQGEVEHHPAEVDRLEQLAPHLGAVRHRQLAGALLDLADRPQPYRARVWPRRRYGRTREHEQCAERCGDRGEPNSHGHGDRRGGAARPLAGFPYFCPPPAGRGSAWCGEARPGDADAFHVPFAPFHSLHLRT